MNTTTATPVRPRKRIRLTLGAMMVVVLAIGGGLGWIAYRARVQREAVAAILKIPRASVRYHWEPKPGTKDPNARPPGPKWLRDALGADVFDTVVEVSVSIKDETLLRHVGRLDRVESLYLAGTGKALSADAMAQVGSLSRLQSFGVSSQVPNAGIPNAEGFFPHLADKRHLTSLSLPSAAPTDAEMAHLAGLTALERIEIDGRNVTDAGFARLSGLNRLKSVVMGGVHITTLEPLRGMSGLEMLHLNPVGRPIHTPRPISLEPLRNKANLESVRVGGNAIDDEGLEGIESLTKLALLVADGTGLTTKGAARLGSLPNLGTLILRSRSITDDVIAGLAGSPKLVRLWLSDTSVRDLGVIRPALKNIVNLCLVDAPVQDDSLAALSGLKNLRLLRISGCIITDAGFSKITSLPSLTTLSLDRTPLTDAGIANLSRFPGLSTLMLSRTKVTDAGMASLAGLPKLSSLYLSDTLVTDAAIPHLSKLFSCRLLELYGTKITPEGEIALKQALPGVRITRNKPRDVF